MPSAKKLADSKGGGGGESLLHGSDFPKGSPTLQVKIIAAREAPVNFKSPLILDIEEKVPGKTALALNVTNTRALADLLGDDYFDWPGATITITRVPTRNPSTGEQAWGISVTDAQPFRGKRKPEPSAKPAKAGKPSKVKPGSTQDDEIPF